jgi:polyisoprenoid-binding protein YceI
MRPLPLFALILAAGPVLAQSPASAPPQGEQGGGRPPMLHGDTTKPVAAGTYKVEPYHTQVNFAVSHMGITPFSGTFSQASGSLTIDPANPETAKVSIVVPIASVMTTSAKLNEELVSPDWFDAAKFPTATFVSTAVHVRGQGAAIEGSLTLHGVTRPVTIYTRLFGSAVNPMSKAPSVGFVARTFVKRSDFGVSKYVPLVSDEVELIINAAFEKAG